MKLPLIENNYYTLYMYNVVVNQTRSVGLAASVVVASTSAHFFTTSIAIRVCSVVNVYFTLVFHFAVMYVFMLFITFCYFYLVIESCDFGTFFNCSVLNAS